VCFSDLNVKQPRRHCEERSDEEIQTVVAEIVWIASAFAKLRRTGRYARGDDL
jgi:hypothetical protein